MAFSVYRVSLPGADALEASFLFSQIGIGCKLTIPSIQSHATFVNTHHLLLSAHIPAPAESGSLPSHPNSLKHGLLL